MIYFLFFFIFSFNFSQPNIILNFEVIFFWKDSFKIELMWYRFRNSLKRGHILIIFVQLLYVFSKVLWSPCSMRPTPIAVTEKSCATHQMVTPIDAVWVEESTQSFLRTSTTNTMKKKKPRERRKSEVKHCNSPRIKWFGAHHIIIATATPKDAPLPSPPNKMVGRLHSPPSPFRKVNPICAWFTVIYLFAFKWDPRY